MNSFSLHYESVDGAGANMVVPLVVSLRDEAGRTVGGLMASTYGEWLMTQMVWLPGSARGQGYGRRLLEMAEMEAIRRGCRHACVESGAGVHLPFFERCGYRPQADLPGFLATGAVRGLTKPLG